MIKLIILLILSSMSVNKGHCNPNGNCHQDKIFKNGFECLEDDDDGHDECEDVDD